MTTMKSSGKSLNVYFAQDDIYCEYSGWYSVQMRNFTEGQLAKPMKLEM